MSDAAADARVCCRSMVAFISLLDVADGVVVIAVESTLGGEVRAENVGALPPAVDPRWAVAIAAESRGGWGGDRITLGRSRSSPVVTQIQHS
jgi:hypothetical protein